MSAVPIPAELAHRPLDRHGLVIAWTTAIDEAGEPMQGVNVGARCAEAILDRLCGQCGNPLGYWIVFIGDDVCVRKRDFLEPPTHEVCARYARAACPYLAAERYTGRRDRAGVVQLAPRERPIRMAMYFTRGYRPKLDSDAPMSHADAPKRVEWF